MSGIRLSRSVNLLVAIALLVVVLLTVFEGVATAQVVRTEGGPHIGDTRGRTGDSARWTAMGEYYLKMQAAGYEQPGRPHVAQPSSNGGVSQRGRDADKARWEAMGAYYAKWLANRGPAAQTTK